MSTKKMEDIVKDMKVAVMERCAERIAKPHDSLVHTTTADCKHSVTAKLKKKYF